MSTEKYHVLYTIGMSIFVNDQVCNIPTSDIVSIAFINNYDTMTHSMIRVRLYSDVTLMRTLTSNPDNIRMSCNMDGCICRIEQTEDSVENIVVKPTESISFSMNCYIENKNIPTNEMDNYDDGLRRTQDLNNSVKVPIELYCYDEKLIHGMQHRVRAIYKGMSMLSVMESMLAQGDITNYEIEIPSNQKKYDQVLIPNLSIADSFAFLDQTYGLYTKGGQVFGDCGKLYVCDSAVESITQSDTIPIYVQDAKSNDDTSGIKKLGKNLYVSATDATCVSVITESDIERVLNTTHISSVNVNSLDIQVKDLDILFPTKPENIIDTPDKLHKYANPFVSSMTAARIEEGVTRIDLSGTGFDIAKMKINSRYSFIWQTPLRGENTRTLYRATFCCHVLRHANENNFIADTTMNLCSNYK